MKSLIGSQNRKSATAKSFDPTMDSENQSTASRILIFAFCATVVLATVLFGMVDAGTLSLFCIGAGAIGWLWLIDAWKTGELRYSPSFLQFPILGLIIVGLVQLLPVRNIGASLPGNLLGLPVSRALSLDAFATRLAVVELIAMLIYFAAALVFINTARRLRTVATIIIVLGFAMAVVGIIQHFSGDGRALWLRESPQALPFASFINRHHFGALMEMTLGLALGLLYTGGVERDKRALYVFAVIIMGVALVLTSSRGALLSFFGLLTFLTLAVFSRRLKKKSLDKEIASKEATVINRLMLIGGGLGLILIIFAAVLLLGGDSSLLRGLGATGGAGDLSSSRLQFWQTALLIIRDFPFLGVGLNAFGVAYTRYDTMNGYFRIEQAHNDYLQVLAEAGIIGLALILAFIFLLFRRGWQVFSTTSDRTRRGISIGALAGCFGILIHSFFDFPLRTPANLLTFLILVVLATVSLDAPSLRRHKNRP